MLPLIILAGPTTSKKSDTAIALAEKINGEIIGADSMQVYKYFDIGTGKASREDRLRVPHHLIDILEPDEDFTAFDFKKNALRHIRDLIKRQKVPIITGGTGLYLKVLQEDFECAVQINSEIKKQVQFEILNKGPLLAHKELREIDPVYAKRISPLDKQRIVRAMSVYRQTGKAFSDFIATNPLPEHEFSFQTFLIKRDRKELYANIDRRVDQMIQHGWIEEVKSILARKYPKSLKPFQGIGYKQIIDFLEDKYSMEQTINLIKRDTRHYAKRQMTWFKKIHNSKTIFADSTNSASNLSNKILSSLSKTILFFLFTLCLFFSKPLKVTASESTPYYKALTNFQKGNYDQAIPLLRSINSASPNSTEGKRSLYLLAHSLANINQLNKSIDAFQSVSKSYPEMEDYIRYHLAKVLLKSGEYLQVLNQVNILRNKYPDTLLYAQIQILKSEALEHNGKEKEALIVLSETERNLLNFSKHEQSQSFLPQIIFNQGRLFKNIGNNNQAYERYRLLHIKYPTNQLTQQAKLSMVKMAKQTNVIIKTLTIDEHAERINGLISNIKYQQVVIEIKNLLKKHSQLPGPFYFYLARAQKGLRKRNLSNDALRKFINLYPEHARIQEALFKIGRNLWNTGYYSDGLKYFNNSININLNSNLANQARFFIGKMHEEKKRYSQATKYYTTLIEKFKTSEYAERAAWQLGWLNYTKGDFQKAFDYFNESNQKYPTGLFIENGMFWNAKSAQKLKREKLAQQIYTDLSIKFPYTYYGIRAGEKITDKKPIPQKVVLEEMLIKSPKLSTNSQSHYLKGVELSATSFYEEARHEIKSLENSVRKNFSGIIWITSLYNKAHAYTDTVRIMQLYKDFKTKIGEKELTNNFWKNFYPLAYAEIINSKAKKLGVNPYFIKGLIRQESLFNADVQSRAGAIGLMQIMPETGRLLYANSDMTGSYNANILFNPEVNIQLGIQYVHELKKQFKKNRTHILISYNAGPHNLKKWLKRFSRINDPDVFIESIPYPETRKYVKKVLRNHGIYKIIYP